TPPTNGVSSANRPSGRTGLTTGSPFARQTAKSSAPNAGARCTSPVPSSVLTKSAVSTRWASGMSTSSNGRRYTVPASSAPVSREPPRQPSPSTLASSGSATTTGPPGSPGRSATTYVTSGFTATAVLDTSVHGVVVHTSRSVPARGPSTMGSRTVTDGSTT